TLTNGATQNFGNDNGVTNRYGGGVWCEELSAVVSNCVLTGNSAEIKGGGAYGGTLKNCILTGNSVNGAGAGASGSALINCTLTINAAAYGGAAHRSTLENCTLA